MGAIDATVQLTLRLLPDNLLLASVFIASCFISLSVGTSVGTIVALAPVATGLAHATQVSTGMMTAIVVGGAFLETIFPSFQTPRSPPPARRAAPCGTNSGLT